MQRSLGVAVVTIALAVSGCAATPAEKGRGVPPFPFISTSSTGSKPPAAPLVGRRAHVAAKPRPAAPARTPCTANRLGQWVFVSIRDQHMWMCARHRVAYQTAITTGMTGPYTRTPTGRYRIQGLNRDSTLTLNTGATYSVKYWIPFNAPLFGFHDSSWQHFPYGSPKYRTRGSHGCVHMPLKAIAFLYQWGHIGTRVRINR